MHDTWFNFHKLQIVIEIREYVNWNSCPFYNFTKAWSQWMFLLYNVENYPDHVYIH